MSEIKEWRLKFLSLHTVFHAFISKRGLKENALMFYLQCPFVLCRVLNPSKIIKMRKQPSQGSPTHNCLYYNIPRWNFWLHGGFTKFHTLIWHCETWWSLWMPKVSHGSSINQQVTHRWNLWRLFANLLFFTKNGWKTYLFWKDKR